MESVYRVSSRFYYGYIWQWSLGVIAVENCLFDVNKTRHFWLATLWNFEIKGDSL